VIGDGGFVEAILVLFHRRPETTDTFPDSFAEHRSTAKRPPSARQWIELVRSGRPIPPHTLERLGEPRLQEPTQLGSGLKLRNRVQLLECRGERI